MDGKRNDRREEGGGGKEIGREGRILKDRCLLQNPYPYMPSKLGRSTI